MEFKGTPGKWALDHENNPKIRVIKADYSEDVCDCLLESDALLIAHAPELLEALKKMCEFHEKNATWDKGDNGYYEAKRLITKSTTL